MPVTAPAAGFRASRTTPGPLGVADCRSEAGEMSRDQAGPDRVRPEGLPAPAEGRPGHCRSSLAGSVGPRMLLAKACVDSGSRVVPTRVCRPCLAGRVGVSPPGGEAGEAGGQGACSPCSKTALRSPPPAGQGAPGHHPPGEPEHPGGGGLQEAGECSWWEAGRGHGRSSPFKGAEGRGS